METESGNSLRAGKFPVKYSLIYPLLLIGKWRKQQQQTKSFFLFENWIQLIRLEDIYSKCNNLSDCVKLNYKYFFLMYTFVIEIIEKKFVNFL